MRNGKLVVFEAADGLRSVKHPCCHWGEHMGKMREKDTLDLFASDERVPNGQHRLDESEETK